MNDLSSEQIKAKLAEIEESKAALEAAYTEKMREARDDAIEQIKAFVEGNGFDLKDILADLMPQKPQKKARARSEKPGSYPVYTLIADPAKTYVRGKMPGWLVDAIKAAGLDPATLDGREKFKAAHMRKEAA